MSEKRDQTAFERQMSDVVRQKLESGELVVIELGGEVFIGTPEEAATEAEKAERILKNHGFDRTPTTDRPTFWRWFFLGINGQKSGLAFFVDRWLVLHAFVGVGVALLLPLEIGNVASAVLLPISGALVGLSFAWIGAAYTILQSREFEQLAKHNPGGLEVYAYQYQSAILVVLVTISAWGFAATGILDRTCPWACPGWLYTGTVATIFFLSSMALRECWQVVGLTQQVLIFRAKAARIARESEG